MYITIIAEESGGVSTGGNRIRAGKDTVCIGGGLDGKRSKICAGACEAAAGEIFSHENVRIAVTYFAGGVGEGAQEPWV
jgi:hypothetical protein